VSLSKIHCRFFQEINFLKFTFVIDHSNMTSSTFENEMRNFMERISNDLEGVKSDLKVLNSKFGTFNEMMVRSRVSELRGPLYCKPFVIRSIYHVSRLLHGIEGENVDDAHELYTKTALTIASNLSKHVNRLVPIVYEKLVKEYKAQFPESTYTVTKNFNLSNFFADVEKSEDQVPSLLERTQKMVKLQEVLLQNDQQMLWQHLITCESAGMLLLTAAVYDKEIRFLKDSLNVQEPLFSKLSVELLDWVRDIIQLDCRGYMKNALNFDFATCIDIGEIKTTLTRESKKKAYDQLYISIATFDVASSYYHGEKNKNRPPSYVAYLYYSDGEQQVNIHLPKRRVFVSFSDFLLK